MEAKKVTCRSSRDGSAMHNDRQFDMDKAPHIDQDRTKLNKTWACNPGMSFAASELKFYEERYGRALELQNERHRARRQYKRVKTMEDVIKTGNMRPDETVLQIGNVTNNADVTRRDFIACVNEFMKELRAWSRAHGDHVHLLDCALHFDEQSPHAHLRDVIDYTDVDGVVRIGQEEGLKQAGLEPPDPSKPIGRYNNRKQTFSAMCREMWADICEAHGYTIDRTPDPDHQNHLDIPEWKALQAELEKLDAEREALAAKTAEAEGLIADAASLRDRFLSHCHREGVRVSNAVRSDSSDLDRAAAEIESHGLQTGSEETVPDYT